MKLQALKERLKTIAKERNLTGAEVWNQLAFERFLARLAKSKHHDKFIFKGGLLLSQYIKIGRETVDLDFLMKDLKASEDAIKNAILEISSVNLDDHFNFDYESIERLEQPHMEYDGFRVTLKMSYETMSDKVQIDIGVGDIVNPDEMNYKTFDYKGSPLFSDAISIQVYPLETILAEKLETIVSKGAFNSRMKDYHDVVLILRSGDLTKGSEIKRAIQDTFTNRGTAIDFPLSFSDEQIEGLQKYWGAHLKKIGSRSNDLKLPLKISDIITEINTWTSNTFKGQSK